MDLTSRSGKPIRAVPEADRLPLSIALLAAVILPTVAFVAAWEMELGAKWIRG
jgi:hypothetical protein